MTLVVINALCNLVTLVTSNDGLDGNMVVCSLMQNFSRRVRARNVSLIDLLASPQVKIHGNNDVKFKYVRFVFRGPLAAEVAQLIELYPINICCQ